MLQTTVRRAYTGGFAGQLVADGPRRAKPGRIMSDAGNAMSRAFGWLGEEPNPGDPQAGTANVATVEVGGDVFFGVLGQPTSYALFGTVGDTLGASNELPEGSLGEFFDMVTGMIVEVFNETTAVKNIEFGNGVAYVSGATTAGENPQGVPVGGLVTFTGATAPAGMTAIPNARVVSGTAAPASAAGDPESVLVVIQLTQ